MPTSAIGAIIRAVPGNDFVSPPTDDGVSTTFDVLDLPNVDYDVGGFTGITPNALVVPRDGLYLVVATYDFQVSRSLSTGVAAVGWVGTEVFGAVSLGARYPLTDLFAAFAGGTPPGCDLSLPLGDGTPHGSPSAVALLSAGATLTLRATNRIFIQSSGLSSGHDVTFTNAQLAVVSVD